MIAITGDIITQYGGIYFAFLLSVAKLLIINT